MLNIHSASGTPVQQAVVCLFDFDNTLFDNDGFRIALAAQLDKSFGKTEQERYWSIYDQRRDELGYADYLGSLEQFRIGSSDEAQLLQMSAFLLDYDFSSGVYLQSLETIARMRSVGLPVILSDGDIVFQPRKIQRSGLWEAVDGRVLVYVHKQDTLDAMQRRYPASHYVMVDDKPQILAAMKRTMGARLTTVFVRQGHYAAEADHQTIRPPPDLCIDQIGDLHIDQLTPLLPASANATTITRPSHRLPEAKGSHP